MSKQKKRMLEPPQPVLDFGYDVHAFTTRGRAHGKELLVSLDELEAYMIKENPNKVYSTDFAEMRKTINLAQAAFDAMDEAHNNGGEKLTKKLNIRPIVTGDWVDEDGSPKGFGSR